MPPNIALTPPPVSLPWAQKAWAQATTTYLTAHPPNSDAAAPPESSAADTAGLLAAGLGQDAPTKRPQPNAAPLYRSKGIYKPLATLPAEERQPLAPETLLRVAVALDVLATHTRRLPGGSVILADLTAVAVEVGRLSGVAQEGHAILLQLGAGSTGLERARLSQEMATVIEAARSPQPNEPAIARCASTPFTVEQAMRCLEAAAQIVINEARLVLEKRQEPDYFQV